MERAKYLAVLAVFLAAALASAATNSTAVNATYVVTPSGTIHIVYKTNGTELILNFNNKTITANLKTVYYNGTTAYYIHVVGSAVGRYNATYVSQLLNQLYNSLKAGNKTQAFALLQQLAKYVAESNATKRAKLNIMVTAKAINSTAPNATILKAKVEYEIERRARAMNGTSSELEVKAHVRDLSALATFLSQLAKRIEPLDSTAASQLAKAAAYIANFTASVREAEIKLGNGTVLEIKKTGQGYKVEIEIERGKKAHDNEVKESDKGKGGEEKGKKEETERGGKDNSDSKGRGDKGSGKEKDEGEDKGEKKGKGK
ncbi:hypothetical protein [Pyrobaculum aerophilum]|uniref:Uncharacterized protein n=1 Tax=Pyrobaculum aerophilum TaxID=13773 RepID=A0A371R4Z4_9CREN|nr:hypothetical protein [Pyrobaculum aerophilum]RFA95585.1 hypothetical protein CGL51_07420 [Pyrobaculum aerophilum]RFA99153.1 hypothetical protein CGL52_04720 [Pyrobaculum aerophilum]